MSAGSTRPYRSGSHSSGQSSRLRKPTSADILHSQASTQGSPALLEDRPYGIHLATPRTESSPAAGTQALSISQKTPTRSFYYHRSIHGALGPIDASHRSSQEVREQTVELASLALSDAASGFGGTPPAKQPTVLVSGDGPPNIESLFDEQHSQDNDSSRQSTDTSRPEAIEELSEPDSPEDMPDLIHNQLPSTSALTAMLRSSPSDDISLDANGSQANETGPQKAKSLSVNIGEESGSEDTENTALMQKLPSTSSHDFSTYGTNGDVERGKGRPKRGLGKLEELNRRMILFPLGEPVFANLGSDGISMFYISCIVSQLVYSCGGSIFKGGVGSEMIEVVPFFHKMAFMILNKVGRDNQKAVLATTILSYAISSILTGAVFFLMGVCRLGSLIGFFPRHILIGCIGGVGWFLVATGVEVSARLSGNLEYNLKTLQKLFQLDTVFLWIIPFIIAIVLLVAKRWVRSNFLVGGYFIAVACIFYFFKFALRFDVELLRQNGWIFDAPEADNPWYHFYELYDFNAVNWEALVSTIPAMFALTFFGVLHVPINVPALGISTGEDNLNVDRELIAHGISNALSGLLGSIQNYLVYTNSLLFMDSGGSSRLAGVMLAFATFGILLVGPVIIGFIPIMVVGALIFMLGVELMQEALVDTWGKLHRLEYLTVVIIVVTMGAWDFVIGIFVGIVLACINFVVQTSRKSAIRATYTGQVAGSTVRRHPLQYRFLRDAGTQTHVIKLAGFLFFGTIVSVENRIRALLEEEAFDKRPIRFLVVDLSYVNGLDFSAAEAFTRINRILRKRNVQMIISGLNITTEVGISLHNVGLLVEENEVEVFEDLNSALEYCENELLQALYTRREALTRRNAPTDFLDVPKAGSQSIPVETVFSSPRRHYLQQVATSTLAEENAVPPSRWQNFKQPLPLILQTFQDLTEKNEDFWFRILPYFEKKEYSAGTVLYGEGDRPNGFYLLEDGILRAEYDQPQGKYYESIVAGTTCGELPFFSATRRTATVSAERDSVAWQLNNERWQELQKKAPDVAQELLRISLKLTSERMSSITSYVLTTAG